MTNRADHRTANARFLWIRKEKWNSIIEENAKTIKDWLKHLDFEHEHPGYGKDVYKKLDEIITEAQKIKED